MKRYSTYLLGTMLGLWMLVALTPAHAGKKVEADELNFTLVNKTGLVIDQLYISPADEEEWGQDVLGVDTLPDGETVDIEFDGGEAEKKWDLKIVDEDEDEVAWEALDLSKISKVTLFYTKGGKPTAKVE